MLKITPLHQPGLAPVYATSWQAVTALYRVYKPVKSVQVVETTTGTYVHYCGYQVMHIETVEHIDAHPQLPLAAT